MKIGVKMYFPSYRMCKMAIEELVHSFIFFLLSTFEYSRFKGASMPARPAVLGQPCRASRAGQAGEPGSPGTADPARLAQLARKPP